MYLPENDQALVYAILGQAVYDYKKALRKIEKEECEKTMQAKIARIEKFFHSEWFTIICDLEPEVIIRRIKRDYNYEKSQNKK